MIGYNHPGPLASNWLKLSIKPSIFAFNSEPPCSCFGYNICPDTVPKYRDNRYQDPEYDYTTFPECAAAAQDAYLQAGITNPREELALAEVHDCFTPTELILMEDLKFSERGQGWEDVLNGDFALDGAIPVNTDGGLKSFGHPVGASGIRMHYECWLQLRREAPAERQISDTSRNLGLVNNLGGYPGEMVSFVSILGTEKG